MTDNNPQPIILDFKPSRKARFKAWAQESLPILGLYAVGMIGLVLVYKNYTVQSLAIEQNAADEKNDYYGQFLEAIRNGDFKAPEDDAVESSDTTVPF